MLPLDGCKQSWTGGVVESELSFQLRGSEFESPTSPIQTLPLFSAFIYFLSINTQQFEDDGLFTPCHSHMEGTEGLSNMMGDRFGKI